MNVLPFSCSVFLRLCPSRRSINESSQHKPCPHDFLVIAHSLGLMLVHFRAHAQVRSTIRALWLNLKPKAIDALQQERKTS